MKTSPFISTLIVLNLGLLTFILLWTTKRELTQTNRQQAPEVIQESVVQAYPEFRFSSTPKSITLKDVDGKVIYKKESFDDKHELDEEEALLIPVNDEKQSEIQLEVVWQKEATPYHFFTMQFYGFENGKFGTAVSSDLYENILLEW